MDIEDVKEICRERDIHTVECSFPDASGLPRGKRLPVPFFTERGYEGFDLADAALIWNRKCEIFQEVEYSNFGTGYPDMKAVADLSTFRPIPWRPGAASVVCDCYLEDGSEAPVSTRNILKSVIDEAHGMGYGPKAASELEFYIFEEDGRTPLYQELDIYSLTRGASLERLLERVRLQLEEFGIRVEACHPEYGPAQVEVTFRYDDALRTADDTMLFKAGIKEMAEQEGLKVSFMAKPFAEQSGSGYHIHQSLTDLSSGEPLFAGVGHHDALAGTPMGSYLGGMLDHFAPFTAVGSPTINAYKRVQGYTFAPTNVSWGIDNRTVGVRAIVGHGPGNRLEWRNGAPDANPYLLMAASIAAGLEGVREGVEPPPMIEGDAYARDDLELLPDTFEAALDALEAHEFAKKVLGEFLPVFLIHGRAEVEMWRGVVTDWEWERYFDV